MEHLYDIIIVGGGPAGYTAALYASRAGLDMLLIERMGAGGQMTQTGDIDNYPGFDNGIDGFELAMRMQKGAERFGAKTVYAEVESTELSGRIKIINTKNAVYKAKTVVVATGASPKPLGLANEKELVGRGLHYCAHCDGRFYKDKTVVVVGGGNSAAEDALYLSRIAKTVYLVHRRNELRAARLYSEAIARTENIIFLPESEIAELKAEPKLNQAIIRSVASGETKVLECDGVFVAIGRSPITDFLGSELETDKNGYIIADETTKTNCNGVFAAGDVRTKALRQIVTAVADGAVAVHFAEMYIDENEF